MHSSPFFTQHFITISPLVPPLFVDCCFKRRTKPLLPMMVSLLLPSALHCPKRRASPNVNHEGHSRNRHRLCILGFADFCGETVTFGHFLARPRERLFRATRVFLCRTSDYFGVHTTWMTRTYRKGSPTRIRGSLKNEKSPKNRDFEGD